MITFNDLRAANVARLPEFKNKSGGLAHSKPDGSDWNPGQWLQALIGEVGEYANIRKKYERGDITFEEYEREAKKEIADIQTYLDILARRCLDKVENGVVVEAHPTGVNLGQVTLLKFNEVTRRVGSNVFLSTQGVEIAKSDWDRQRLNYESDPANIHPCYD